MNAVSLGREARTCHIPDPWIPGPNPSCSTLCYPQGPLHASDPSSFTSTTHPSITCDNFYFCQWLSRCHREAQVSPLALTLWWHKNAWTAEQLQQQIEKVGLRSECIKLCLKDGTDKQGVSSISSQPRRLSAAWDMLWFAQPQIHVSKTVIIQSYLQGFLRITEIIYMKYLEFSCFKRIL